MGRVLRLYKVLMRPKMREVFLIPPPPNASPAEVRAEPPASSVCRCVLFTLLLLPAPAPLLLQALKLAHWVAIIMSVALAYQLRLPAALRVDFAAHIDAMLREQLCPAALSVQGVVSACMDRLYEGTFVPKGIAPTRCGSCCAAPCLPAFLLPPSAPSWCSALKENIYACVVCLVAGIPLNITGPCVA